MSVMTIIDLSLVPYLRRYDYPLEIPPEIPEAAHGAWREQHGGNIHGAALDARARERSLKARIRLRLMRTGRQPGYPQPGAAYLLNLICAVAPENGFAQDAIEWELVSHRAWRIHPLGDAEEHTARIMAHYDAIMDAYHRHLQQQEQARSLDPVFDFIQRAA